jgi:DNA-binding transcriptional MocR family regulator
MMSEPITEKEFETIKIIEEFGPYISQREVAEKLNISRTAAQHRIEQLERKGWIQTGNSVIPRGKEGTAQRTQADHHRDRGWIERLKPMTNSPMRSASLSL